LLILVGCQTRLELDPEARSPKLPVNTDALMEAPFCGEAPPDETLASLTVNVWRAPGVDPWSATYNGLAAMAVWTRLGLFSTIQLHDEIAADRLIIDTPAGPSLQPAKDILSALPASDDGDVHIVVMDRFFAEDSSLARTGVKLRGLTVSPHLPVDPTSPLAELHLDKPVPPTVFIDLSAGPRAPGDLELTSAHEVGHALGLPHRTGDEVLMSDGELSLRCLPGLSAEEREQLGRRFIKLNR